MKKKPGCDSTRLHAESVEAFLNRLEEERLRAERVLGMFCGSRPPSRYPGLYGSSEVDDGRLDPEARTRHFVTPEEVVDEDEPYAPDETDENSILEDLQRGSKLPRWNGVPQPERERGYPMPRTVRAFHARKPQLKNVLILVQGRLVQYQTLPRQD